MKINSLRDGFPDPESGLRRKNPSEGEIEVNKNTAKIKRRRRKVLQKTRSLAEEITYGSPSSSSDGDTGGKRCRKKINQKRGTLIGGGKIDRVPETDAGASSRGATSNSYGKVSLIGRRREMEDAVAVELGFLKGYDFFGVYDGHGGWQVAQACSEMLHKLLVMISGDENEEEIDWARLMDEVFKKMDEEVNKGGAAMAIIGSTAVVAVVGEEVVVVANCGDSRAVLSRGGAAIPLSDDHKPDRADELERIEVSGGKVINWNGQRVLGVLATSRSIGDKYLKPFVIAEPEVKIIARSDTDEFLILASDGLWDVVSNDLACQVARRCLDGSRRRRSAQVSEGNCEPDETISMNESGASRAAAVLAELAMARGSGDNISVIVVSLRQ